MTPDRWQAVGDLFEQALALPTGEQSALVDRVSATDEEVRRSKRWSRRIRATPTGIAG
jgi:hypothetical protein